jgi:hypothetical protein
MRSHIYPHDHQESPPFNSPEAVSFTCTSSLPSENYSVIDVIKKELNIEGSFFILEYI